MNTIARRWQGQGLVLLTIAALMSACAEEGPLGPDPAQLMTPDTVDPRDGIALGTDAEIRDRIAEPIVCGNLSVTDATLVFRAYARGVQIYEWTGGDWAFRGPSATLYADAGGRGVVGSHGSGPAWESVGGSKVTGVIVQRCTADADAIDWLLLATESIGGPGVFDGVTRIQRVNTVGGKAPGAGGSEGEIANVPYTAEYLFYR